MGKLSIVSWNVNGIRAILKKDFVSDIKKIQADIICLQETKASVEEVKTALELFPEYKHYVNSSKTRKGYSGTVVLTKNEPEKVNYDLGVEDHDQEGRVITVEYNSFFLVNVYTPNSGRGLRRLDYRETWDEYFFGYLKRLEESKPVILCGDLNVAHKEIDIARAKENYNKSAGFTQKEIDGLTRYIDHGFVDAFRHFYPEEIKYTYWNYMFNARSRNVGWRIDYFLISKSLIPEVEASYIHNEYYGSDHCPIKLVIKV